MILGMIQAPPDLNFVGRVVSTKNGNELAFFLDCTSQTNLVLTQPEIDYFEEFESYFDWETGPMKYGPHVNEDECNKMYDDTRITMYRMEDSVLDTHLVYRDFDDDFNPTCGICDSKIEDTVYEVEADIETDSRSPLRSQITYRPVCVYLHRDCIGYYLSSILEGIDRYRESTEVMASVI